MKTKSSAGLALCLLLPLTTHMQASVVDPVVVVSFPSQQQVTEHKQQIGNDAFYNSIARNMVHGGMTVSALVACYIVYNQLGIRVFDKNNLTPEQQGITGLQEDVAILTAALSERIKELPEMIKNMTVDEAGKIVSKGSGWGSFFGTMAANILVSSGIGHVIGRVTKYVLYNESILWFKDEKTNLAAIYEEISALHPTIEAVKKGTYKVSRQQSDAYRDEIIRMHNGLVTEVERIVAYMNYSIEKHNIPITDIKHNALLGNYLFKRNTTIATKLHELAARYELEKQQDDRLVCVTQMYDAIEQYVIELHSSIGSFARSERQLQRA